MNITGRRRTIVRFFAAALFLAAAALGTGLGLSIATNRNTRNMEELMASRQAIPSRVLDIEGRLITEFFSDEKRNIVPITSLSGNLINAILTREDAPFFRHTGFSVMGFFRALWQNMRSVLVDQGSLQGASTITMQLAGNRHADRSIIKISRKLKELWWAYQLERRYTKLEILEQYLNSVYFGHTTYGVEAASQFFFGHSSTELTPAESVMLAIQLAGSSLYSPFINPGPARKRQEEILNQMVTAGHLSQNEADQSLQEFWISFDWTRSPTDSPYFDRLAQDRAPYFSEYIRREVEQHLFGQQNIYRDGYTIHTSLNLEYQDTAEKLVSQGLQKWNQAYQYARDSKTAYAVRDLAGTLDMLSLMFNLPEIHNPGGQSNRTARQYIENELTPVMDMMAMTFGLTDLKSLTNIAYNRVKNHAQKNKVESALITLDNQTGYILAMVGGSEFNRNNQFNRAMDARVMPGSAFKPLYYSQAISSGLFTPASRLHDGPEVFISPDGVLYAPKNFVGRWTGDVLLRDALSRSMNIPALKVFEAIGFDAAIKRSADLLGITDPQTISETFDRVYPLGLGIVGIAPVELARAYATLANRGRAVEPIAIRYIEDRDGNIITNPEQELRESQERRNMQVLSPQAAYVMTSMLQSTVSSGTLAYARRSVEGFDGMPMAGKTGTTQNWTNAWTMGYSPYYTTALWMGFDQQGNSLGVGQTGATATGPVWARYMKTIHEDMPRIDFSRPETGVVELLVDKRTGMLPEEGTPEDETRLEVFIAGTQPTTVGNLTQFLRTQDEELTTRISAETSRTVPKYTGPQGAVFTQELFKELGLETLYMDDSYIDTPASSGGNRGNTSIMD